MNLVIIKTDILNVYKFIDWILNLPKPLENEFWQELKAYEEDRKMPYITTGERIGYDRGKVEGKVEERQSIALNLFRQGILIEVIAQATGWTVIQLQEIQAKLNG
jgi:predicted transposase YdaD